MKAITSLVAGCFFLSALAFTSCKKENSVRSQVITEEESQTISQENAAADAEYDEVIEIALTADADLETGALEQNDATDIDAGARITPHIFKELAFRLGPCVEVTVTGHDFPKTVVVNYGEGCLCRDGKFRKGAIVLHFTGPLRRTGSTLTVTLRDYYVNRAHIEGIKTITNLSSGGVVKYSVKIDEGKISWPNGRGFTYTGTRTVSQTGGMDTQAIRDDVYEIQGRNQTGYANGVVVVKNTESPLVKKISCQWLVQGILKIKINDRTLYVDYGTGECDNKATLSWHSGEREITLN